MSDNIVWGPPPSKTNNPKPRKWAPILREVREKLPPDEEWGRIKEAFPKKFAYSLATRINTGKVAGVKAGQYEAVSREVNGKHYVWVKPL